MCPCMCDTGRGTLGPFHSVDFCLSDPPDSYFLTVLDVRDGLELHLQKGQSKTASRDNRTSTVLLALDPEEGAESQTITANIVRMAPLGKS